MSSSIMLNPRRRRTVDVAARRQWLDDLNALVRDIELWSAENDWAVKVERKRIREDEIGVYSAPALIIQTAQGRLYFTPIARYIAGTATGRIEMTAPSFRGVVLIRRGHSWRFYDDNLVDLKKTWSKKNFNVVARELLDRV